MRMIRPTDAGSAIDHLLDGINDQAKPAKRRTPRSEKAKAAARLRELQKARNAVVDGIRALLARNDNNLVAAWMDVDVDSVGDLGDLTIYVGETAMELKLSFAGG